MTYRSYPGGSSVAGDTPAHAQPFVLVDPEWVLANGSREQRRRIKKMLKRAPENTRKADAGATQASARDNTTDSTHRTDATLRVGHHFTERK